VILNLYVFRVYSSYHYVICIAPFFSGSSWQSSRREIINPPSSHTIVRAVRHTAVRKDINGLMNIFRIFTAIVLAFGRHKRNTLHSCAAFGFHPILTQVVFVMKLAALITFRSVLQNSKTSFRLVLPIPYIRYGAMTSADF
jgi:hypothetical protein